MSESQSAGLRDFVHYTRRAGVDQAAHKLEGILRGIAADGLVTADESKILLKWLAEHRSCASRHPFNELVPVINRAMRNHRIDDEERADLLWLCKKFTGEGAYYNRAGNDLQRLQGILAGAFADHRINQKEVLVLRTWLNEHEHLAGCWPYDEICSVLSKVLADGQIDDREEKMLLHVFEDFVVGPEKRSLLNPDLENEDEQKFMGVCAVRPTVTFDGRVFSYTGESKRSTPTEIQRVVEHKGGAFAGALSEKVDYLVVGAEGNPCWALACYGRKIEQASQYRRSGLKITIVHENDFWDACESAG